MDCQLSLSNTVEYNTFMLESVHSHIWNPSRLSGAHVGLFIVVRVARHFFAYGGLIYHVAFSAQ